PGVVEARVVVGVDVAVEIRVAIFHELDEDIAARRCGIELPRSDSAQAENELLVGGGRGAEDAAAIPQAAIPAEMNVLSDLRQQRIAVGFSCRKNQRRISAGDVDGADAQVVELNFPAVEHNLVESRIETEMKRIGRIERDSELIVSIDAVKSQRGD